MTLICLMQYVIESKNYRVNRIISLLCLKIKITWNYFRQMRLYSSLKMLI